MRKMFRVVNDRERWFGIVMGEPQEAGERATEERAARVPLPLLLAKSLTMDLSLIGGPLREHPAGGSPVSGTAQPAPTA